MAYGKAEAFINLVTDVVLEGFRTYQVILNILVFFKHPCLKTLI